MALKPYDLRRRLYVIFRGEEGLDYGGLARWARPPASACLHRSGACLWKGVFLIAIRIYFFKKLKIHNSRGNHSYYSGDPLCPLHVCRFVSTWVCCVHVCWFFEQTWWCSALSVCTVDIPPHHRRAHAVFISGRVTFPPIKRICGQHASSFIVFAVVTVCAGAVRVNSIWVLLQIKFSTFSQCPANTQETVIGKSC